jgi:restriction system protein
MLRPVAINRESDASTAPAGITEEPVEPMLPEPLERLAASVAQLDSSTAAELVGRLHAQPPELLEKAVLQLLVSMGYGGSAEAADHLGGPGDGGFDGVINQDRLGLGP